MEAKHEDKSQKVVTDKLDVLTPPPHTTQMYERSLTCGKDLIYVVASTYDP